MAGLPQSGGLPSSVIHNIIIIIQRKDRSLRLCVRTGFFQPEVIDRIIFGKHHVLLIRGHSIGLTRFKLNAAITN